MPTERWNSSQELSDFLRKRRAALRPQDAGIADFGEQRRVPGLRREELAELAGISVKYYTRLEQGEDHQMSDSVLRSLAKALRLTADEHAHLMQLARPGAIVRTTRAKEEVRPSVRALADSVTGQAALIVGRRADVLGGNRLAHGLLGLPYGDDGHGEAGVRPNFARWVFLEPAARDLFADWEAQAADITSYLRLAASAQPDDQSLNELIGEMSVKSEDFARIWSAHPVSDCLHSVREYRHPVVGRLVLMEEVLRLPDDPGQRIVFSGARPGTESAERLALLESVTV